MNFDDLTDEILAHPSAKSIIENVEKELTKAQKDRKEFRKWLKDDANAEFINGLIIMQSPVKRGHLEATENLFQVLSIFANQNFLGEVAFKKALIGLKRNDYMPDIVFWNKETAKSFTDEIEIFPAPNLVIEVFSKETKNRDKGVKFDDYAAHQIPEYWMIDYDKKIVYQYTLAKKSDTVYTLLNELEDSEMIESHIIKGFKIPVAAIFDKKVNLRVLSEFLEK